VIEHRWQLWLVCWGAAAVLLAVLYVRQRRTRNATLVDAGWAVSVALAAILAALLGPGAAGYRILIGATGAAENLRIAWLVLGRTRGHADEDTRYRELRRRWRARGREQLTFAIFYQAQALLAAVLGTVFVLAVFAEGALGALAWAGAVVWLAAASLELCADAQLRRFKADPANRGKTMRSGLWRYSRHPNYFFQFLTWVAYALVAVEAPWGWLGFLSPALLLALVLFVTGIPPAEEQALRSRGDDYRRYQRETSPFIPWLPRSSTGS
jgi:steroid 5-alpha reductase family enzyme